MPSTSALIGYTGFVGGTLLRQARFDDRFRSTDIADIAGRRYDLLVCAGAPAEKWKANADPAADMASLQRLMDALARVHAEQVVLVSTVDVYPVPRGVDEGTPLDPAEGQPYGRHRLLLERFVAERFETLVVRLPGLYGHGLKKNIIFDLLNDNLVDRIDPAAVFQFYGLDRLWHDIETARAARLGLVNFATEPVAVADIARHAFERVLAPKAGGPAASYDVRTRHAALFGGRGGYLQTRAEVLDGIAAYVREARARDGELARPS